MQLIISARIILSIIYPADGGEGSLDDQLTRFLIIKNKEREYSSSNQAKENCSGEGEHWRYTQIIKLTAFGWSICGLKESKWYRTKEKRTHNKDLQISVVGKLLHLLNLCAETGNGKYEGNGYYLVSRMKLLKVPMHLMYLYS